MQQIKTLLVDDEFLALNLLEEFIRKIPELKIIGREKSPMKALEIIQTGEVDLLFLDIQMPTLSGNNLLKTLQNPPVTIFTTAYSEYAIEAFELNAVDYLLKPFSFERLVQAVNKAKEQIRIRREANNPATILIPEKSKDFFSVKVDGKIKKINFSDILCIEGQKEYVRIVCEKERLVTLESLKNLELILPENEFLRVHKSYIVAKSKVQSLEGNMLEVNKQKIPISRNKREEVVKAIFYD